MVRSRLFVNYCSIRFRRLKFQSKENQDKEVRKYVYAGTVVSVSLGPVIVYKNKRRKIKEETVCSYLGH